MHTSILKEDLQTIEDRLVSLETLMNNQMKELQSKEDKWKKMDEKVQNIITNENDIVHINVGGGLFATRLGTLTSIKDTIFYKIIHSGKFDLKKTLFFDRFPTHFGICLDYLRFHKINYKKYSKSELEEIFIEADYYELTTITETISHMLKDIKFTAYEVNGTYTYNGSVVGSQNVDDLNNYDDRSLVKGIVAGPSSGYIVFTLNQEWDINTIEIGGYNGNPSAFSATNGANALIYTSKDKSTWTHVGNILNSYGAYIQTVSLTPSQGTYIKFQASGYIGIGYLRIIKV